jgi:hypothetical protein
MHRGLHKIWKWHLLPVVLYHELTVHFPSELLELCLDVLTLTIDDNLPVFHVWSIVLKR